MTTSTLPPAERTGRGSVSATRTGKRTYEGRNSRDATVMIGPADVPGHFTPGELLKIALAGCAGMSADSVIARRLGDDFESVVWAHGSADPEENLYFAIDEEMLLDLSELDESERKKLTLVISKAIERSCTVARSVQGSIMLTKTVNGESF
jgi:uncharacterized OsmC-like protein